MFINNQQNFEAFECLDHTVDFHFSKRHRQFFSEMKRDSSFSELHFLFKKTANTSPEMGIKMRLKRRSGE